MLVNESPLDRGLRPVAAVIAFVVGAGSVAGVILIVVAAILAVTAAVGFCPLYRVFGIRAAKPEATLPS